MPDLGIGEALAGIFGGGDLLGGLGSLFGIGDAAAATGAGAVGAGAAGAGAADAGLGALVGTGEGLFGGATGLAGTELAGGVSAADIASGAAFGTAGLGALGTAADFLAAPGASAFNAAALVPGVGEAGGGAGALTPTTSAALTPSGVGGTSVFDTGTSGIPGVSAGGAPAATPTVAPAGASASSLAAPAGVSGVPDATAAVTGTQAAAGATPAASSSSISDLLGKAGSGALKSLESNPLGIALGAGGLGYNILEGQKNTANEKALAADASTATANSTALTNSGEALQSYLTSGQLPPAYQQQVTQAIQDAKTTAISNAAQQGQPTDPTKNTALAAELARIDASGPQMQAQVAQQLFSSGTSLVSAGQNAAGLSGSLYQSLVSNDTTQAASVGKAIATLAAAMNGKSSNSIGGTNISVSPS